MNKNMTQTFIPQMEPVYGEEEKLALIQYLNEGGWGTEFNKTLEFENKVAKFTNVKYAIATNNGTISLTLSMLSLGLKPGDEVLIPNLTMIATYTSALMIGLKPILVDIDPTNLCINIEEARRKIGKKTKALVYVSLNGRSHDMNMVKDFCIDNNLFLIEDAAQSLGSYNFDKKHLGSFGDFGSLSFSTPKIISTGQGGMILTNDEDLAHKVRKLKNFGRIEGGNDYHDSVGYNFKFTDFQAVIGIEQMKKLPNRIKWKKEMYELYEELLNHKFVEFIHTDLKRTSPWFIDIYISERSKLMKILKTNNYGSRPIYPPISSQPILNLNEKFPVTEKYSNRGLWLPSSSSLTEDDIIALSNCINEWIR